MPQIKEREIQYLKAFWNELEQEGELLRGQELPLLSDEDFFLFEKTGNRLIYENVYFARRKYLTVFGILSEYGKKKEDVDKLCDVIASVCRERFWALPAHVDFKRLDEKTIDLFAAETAQTLAELLVVLGDRLPADIVELAKREIMDRVLVPFCSSKPPYSWWEIDRCNWSAVCAGSIGMAAIYMDRMGALPEGWKEPCLRRVCAALECYLGGMEDDGACTEGLGYFSYGMSYYTAFAELLHEETGGRVNLMDNPKCGKIAAFQGKCYFGGGVSLSFSDSGCDERFLPGLSAYLSHCFSGIKTPDYAAARGFYDDACYRWMPNERNIRWLLAYGGGESVGDDFKACDLLEKAQWMICKDSEGNGFAAKGGNNDENHNHNDVGNFLFVYRGEMLLADLGAGEYTKDYFGEKRYQILCNRSLGHSVLLIDGEEQCAGEQYRADGFEWNEDNEELLVSFAGAYRVGCIDRLERKIHMEAAEGLCLTVVDSFLVLNGSRTVTENVVTSYVPVALDLCTIEIRGERGVCRVRIWYRVGGNEEWMRAENLRIVPKEHALHDGGKTTVYLLQWDCVIFEKQELECKMVFEFVGKGSD